jgi:hypothetical protein
MSVPNPATFATHSHSHTLSFPPPLSITNPPPFCPTPRGSAAGLHLISHARSLNRISQRGHHPQLARPSQPLTPAAPTRIGRFRSRRSPSPCPRAGKQPPRRATICSPDPRWLLPPLRCRA